MLKRKDKTRITPIVEPVEKVLDIDASMQGNLTFRDPVNIRINGSFEGTLVTVGSLTVGEESIVKATITGETIILMGEVVGNIIATKSLELHAKARLIGDVIAPSLAMEKGAVLQGKLDMITEQVNEPKTKNRLAESYSAAELAKYLSVEKSLVFEWADSGKLPGVKDGSNWRFDKKKVDEWVASGMIK